LSTALPPLRLTHKGVPMRRRIVRWRAAGFNKLPLKTTSPRPILTTRK